MDGTWKRIENKIHLEHEYEHRNYANETMLFQCVQWERSSYAFKTQLREYIVIYLHIVWEQIAVKTPWKGAVYTNPSKSAFSLASISFTRISDI